MNIFRELWRNKTLVWKLGKNDFKTKYAGSYFGILWAFVQPMVTILIYIFIFQFGFRVMDTPNGYPYALWLIAGIIPWFFFSEGIINATKTKIVLNLENDEAKKVQELLHLSEAERMEIVHFERGKGMISTNSNNLTLEFKASQLEKDLITTDRKELKELKERLARYGKQAYGRVGA